MNADLTKINSLKSIYQKIDESMHQLIELKSKQKNLEFEKSKIDAAYRNQAIKNLIAADPHLVSVE